MIKLAEPLPPIKNSYSTVELVRRGYEASMKRRGQWVESALTRFHRLKREAKARKGKTNG